MAITNRTCKVCGKEYRYCNTCRVKDPSWKILCDTEECLEVFEALSDYSLNKNTNVVTKVLKKYNATTKDKYAKYKEVSNYIDEIVNDKADNKTIKSEAVKVEKQKGNDKSDGNDGEV